MANTDFSVLLKAELDRAGLNTDLKQVQEIVKKYHLELTPDLQTKSLRNQFRSVCQEMANDFNRAFNANVSANDVFKVYENKAKQLQQTLEKVNKIQLSFDNGKGDSDYQNRITAITNELEKYGVSADEAQKKTQGLRDILNGFKVDGNFLPDEQLIAQADKLEAEFKAVKVSLDSAKLSYDKFLQPVSSEKASSLIIRINDFLSKNKNITKEAKLELQGFVRLLESGNVSLSDWNKFDTRLKNINIEMREANRLGKTLKQALIEGAKSFAQWTFSSGAVMELYNVARKVPKEVIAVNKAMIELIKVSSASDNELKNYFDEAADSAKKLGASISDVISATADFSRLGYNLKDASLLADVAILYKNVGDGISVDEASSSIVSTMKAFGIEAENAIRIVDIFNEVGNNFAISSGEIGDALKRSASSLSVAGNSIEESVALITAGNTIVQDADTVGTALKTLSLRITSTSSELEAMGEDTEFACETLSDYRDLVLGLTKNKVNIVGDNGEYKSTYEILKGISEVWDEMNSMEQSALMKALFGARQANIGASILENFDIAKDVMKSAEEATGSALKEQENYEKGIQYSLDRLIAKFQEFSNHILDSKLIKGVVDFGTTTIDVVDKVTSALGSLGTIGLIGGGILSKNGIG
jgi:TP901 family phage tail tape measure protein